MRECRQRSKYTFHKERAIHLLAFWNDRNPAMTNSIEKENASNFINFIPAQNENITWRMVPTERLQLR
jgi:hypothetical protein